MFSKKERRSQTRLSLLLISVFVPSLHWNCRISGIVAFSPFSSKSTSRHHQIWLTRVEQRGGGTLALVVLVAPPLSFSPLWTPRGLPPSRLCSRARCRALQGPARPRRLEHVLGVGAFFVCVRRCSAGGSAEPRALLRPSSARLSVTCAGWERRRRCRRRRGARCGETCAAFVPQR
ncbi:hypothetical protein C8R47DRAFT_1092018 [Mycena vitilis]|nr:hypothetical protein C8R47DRAFT_1092018 [Mycena vitilis]